MSYNPNKLSQFWQELKRRKVIYVITVYASAAFVIIELVNNLVEPLNLPPNLSTLVIVVLAVGFPLAIIFSWLFDLTSEGVEKTKPISEIDNGDKAAIPNAWKIATFVSFVVIIGLVVLNLAGGLKQVQAGDIKSLVVLPFDNFTGDDQLEYFVSGMHASLIGDIGKISDLRVICKTSSNVYKDVDMSATEIASELDVDAVVEATVMCLGDSICVQFRLVSTFPEENQLWIAEYKEEKSQILNLYNRVTKQIADEVKIELTTDEELLLAESRTVDNEAYDAYMKGIYYWDHLTPEGLQNAYEYFTIAVEKDPDWAPPYAGLAIVWGGRAQMGFESPAVAIPTAYENLNKALELDPNSVYSHYVSGLFAVWGAWNWEQGEQEFLKVLEIQPNNALCRAYYAHLLNILRRPEEALVQGKISVDLDPLNPLIQGLYAALLVQTGDYEAAIAPAKKVLTLVPNHPLAFRVLRIAYYFTEDYTKSFEILMQMIPFEEDVILNLQNTFDKQGYSPALQEVVNLLELAAQQNFIQPFIVATYYLELKNTEKALEWLEKAFEGHDPDTPYISTYFAEFDQLYDNPRFIAILEKMNLPLPGE